MAVNEKQDLVRDFWPGYKRRSILFIIVLQLAIAVVIIAALVAMQTIVLSDLASILHIIAIVVITIAVNIFGFHLLI